MLRRRDFVAAFGATSPLAAVSAKGWIPPTEASKATIRYVRKPFIPAKDFGNFLTGSAMRSANGTNSAMEKSAIVSLSPTTRSWLSVSR